MRTIINNMREVIEAVNQGAYGVYKDVYIDSTRPEYHILETREEMVQLEQLIKAAKEKRNFDAFDALQAFLGRSSTTDHLSIIYKDKRWFRDPDQLLLEEEMWEQQREDDDWFEEQQRHFSERDEPKILSIFDPLFGTFIGVELTLLTDPGYENDNTRRVRKLAIEQGLLKQI